MKYVKEFLKDEDKDVDEFLLDEEEEPLQELPEALLEEEEDEEGYMDENG